jgi:hypothetical protein
MSAATPGRTIGDLLGELPRQFQKLIRTEVLMARTEILENLGKMRLGGALVGVGLLIGLSALTILLEGFAHSLANAGVPLNLAELSVGALAFVGALAALKAGIGRIKASSLVPQRTIGHLKRDVAAIDPMRDHHE